MAPPRYVRGCWDQNVGKERCQGYAQQQEGRGRGVRPVPGAVRAGGGGLEDPGHAASSTTYGSRTVTHWHDQVTPEEPHPYSSLAVHWTACQPHTRLEKEPDHARPHDHGSPESPSGPCPRLNSVARRDQSAYVGRGRNRMAPWPLRFASYMALSAARSSES